MNRRNRAVRVSARNFRGQSFDQTLAPVTLLAGRNFSGKSSRVQALVLSLLGWLPGVGRTGRDIYDKTATGDPMSVESELAQGDTVFRSWKEQKGSVKYMGTGDSFDFPAVGIDPTEYLSLSEKERVKFLFARAKLPPELTLNSVSATIVANIKNIRLEENTEGSEEVLRATADFAGNFSDGMPDSVQDWLAALVDKMGEKRKLAAQNVQRMEKTQQGNAQVATDDPAPQDAEARLQEAQDALLAAEKELSRLEQVGREANKALADATALAAGAVDETEARAELARLSGEKERVAKLCLVPVTDNAAFAEYQKAFQAYSVAELNWKRSKEALDERRRQITEAQSEKTCPHCGQGVEHLKVKMIADMMANLEDLEATGAERQKLERETKDVLLTAEAQLAKARREVEGTAKAQEAKAKLPALQEALAAARSHWKEKEQVVEYAKMSVASMKQDADNLLAQRARAQQQAAAAQELSRARVEAEVLKQACAMLGELQSKLVDAAVDPLLQTANRLCAPILKSPLVYEGGEVGMVSPETGRFVSHRCFSGTEKALAYAALSVALAAGAPFRLVVMDEFDIDEPNLIELVALLSRLEKEGDIDQAVLAHTKFPQPVEMLENIAVVQLGGGK